MEKWRMMMEYKSEGGAKRRRRKWKKNFFLPGEAEVAKRGMKKYSGRKREIQLGLLRFFMVNKDALNEAKPGEGREIPQTL